MILAVPHPAATKPSLALQASYHPLDKGSMDLVFLPWSESFLGCSSTDPVSSPPDLCCLGHHSSWVLIVVPKGAESLFSKDVHYWQGKSLQIFRAWEVELTCDITTESSRMRPVFCPHSYPQPSSTTWAKTVLISTHTCTGTSILTLPRAEVPSCTG